MRFSAAMCDGRMGEMDACGWSFCPAAVVVVGCCAGEGAEVGGADGGAEDAGGAVRVVVGGVDVVFGGAEAEGRLV